MSGWGWEEAHLFYNCQACLPGLKALLKPVLLNSVSLVQCFHGSALLSWRDSTVWLLHSSTTLLMLQNTENSSILSMVHYSLLWCVQSMPGGRP